MALDANQLEILSVEWCQNPPDQHAEVGAVEPLGQGTLLKYDYEKHLNRLIVRLPRVVDVGERFWIRSNTRCFPSDHVLEGKMGPADTQRPTLERKQHAKTDGERGAD